MGCERIKAHITERIRGSLWRNNGNGEYTPLPVACLVGLWTVHPSIADGRGTAAESEY